MTSLGGEDSVKGKETFKMFYIIHLVLLRPCQQFFHYIGSEPPFPVFYIAWSVLNKDTYTADGYPLEKSGIV